MHARWSIFTFPGQNEPRPGHGTPWVNSGLSRPFRDGWQVRNDMITMTMLVMMLMAMMIEADTYGNVIKPNVFIPSTRSGSELYLYYQFSTGEVRVMWTQWHRTRMVETSFKIDRSGPFSGVTRGSAISWLKGIQHPPSTNLHAVMVGFVWPWTWSGRIGRLGFQFLTLDKDLASSYQSIRCCKLSQMDGVVGFWTVIFAENTQNPLRCRQWVTFGFFFQ